MTLRIPEEFSNRLTDWSSFAIIGNTMPPRDPDEDDEDDDEEEEEEEADEPAVVREPDEDQSMISHTKAAKVFLDGRCRCVA
jgi:hypothetical protein